MLIALAAGAAIALAIGGATPVSAFAANAQTACPVSDTTAVTTAANLRP